MPATGGAAETIERLFAFNGADGFVTSPAIIAETALTARH